MKALIVLPLASLLMGSSTILRAHDTAAPPIWASPEGKTIQSEFIRLDGQSVVIRKGVKQFTIPLAKLSPGSRKQTLGLAGRTTADFECTFSPSSPDRTFVGIICRLPSNRPSQCLFHEFPPEET